MRVDHQIDVRSRGRADRLDDLDRLANRGFVRIAPRILERIELEAAVTFRGGSSSRCTNFFRALADAVPGIRVGRQNVMHPSAEQIVDRPPQSFAGDVEL